MQKKGAMELSIGTIVIIVLAMSMLILGLVLIRTIFTGAKYNVDTMNDKVRDEINKLFVEDKKIVVYLANQKADIKQGTDMGVAFAVKNLKTGTTESSRFDYTVTVANPDEVRQKCRVNENDALSWISTGASSQINIAPGDFKGWIIRFEIPETSPLCTLRYNINVKADAEFYDAESFDVKIKG
tara:strand:- start:1059 stop:1610 length:552 start_codon:yes stop_codon:yes gene_type:complete